MPHEPNIGCNWNLNLNYNNSCNHTYLGGIAVRRSGLLLHCEGHVGDGALGDGDGVDQLLRGGVHGVHPAHHVFQIHLWGGGAWRIMNCRVRVGGWMKAFLKNSHPWIVNYVFGGETPRMTARWLFRLFLRWRGVLLLRNIFCQCLECTQSTSDPQEDHQHHHIRKQWNLKAKTF